jgi:hypothetical protein
MECATVVRSSSPIAFRPWLNGVTEQKYFFYLNFINFLNLARRLINLWIRMLCQIVHLVLFMVLLHLHLQEHLAFVDELPRFHLFMFLNMMATQSKKTKQMKIIDFGRKHRIGGNSL